MVLIESPDTDSHIVGIDKYTIYFNKDLVIVLGIHYIF